MLKKIIVTIGMLVPFVSMGATKSLPFFEPDQMTPFWLPEHSESQSQKSARIAALDAFHVIDQSGTQVDEKAFDNKLSVVNFFFAECPGLCPLMMKSMQQFQRKLGTSSKDVHIFSFSVQPDHDSPQVLKRYAKSYGINLEGWSLLTGDRKEIYHVGKDILKADGSVGAQKSVSSFIHTRNVYLIDAKRRLRGVYDSGDSKAMAFLVQDIAQLKNEKDVTSTR